MSLRDWSVTAASNTSPPPNGCPEGWALSSINDTLRQVMADVRTLAASDTIASATTTDLGTKDSTFLTVSGTTTITGLGTVSAGIYKFVIFSGALTLTHNGTSLILPGAANITTVAGDTALFLSLGSGNWRCMFYQTGASASQPLDAQLTTLAGITAQQATDLSSVSPFIGTLLNDADAATARATLGAGVGTVTSVTGTAPVVSSGGATPAISMAAATASVNGYMTSTYASKLDGIAAGANVGMLVDAGVQGMGTMVMACANCASGLTVAAGALSVPRFDASGPVFSTSQPMSTGTWKNISPWNATASVSAMFQRIV